MAGIFAAGVLPGITMAADQDGSLEERVRALEKKVNQQQKQSGEQQSIKQRLDAIEKEVKDSEKSITEKLGVTMHGLVAVDYLYDVNRPEKPVQKSDGSVAPAPFLRSFENEKNSFTLNLANLHLERQPESGLGFVADLDFGKTADVVNNATFFGRHCSSSDVKNGTCQQGDPITGNGTDFFDARQFYLTYTVPIGSGLKLKAGRFVTLAGAEVIKSYNNINYNITNSMLFGYSIPYTHTGVMGSYAFTDQVSLDLGLVNGWDTVADNNDGKSLHGGLNIAPDPHYSFYLSGTYGAEQPDNGESKTLLITALITVKPTDQLTFIIDYNYGNESNVKLTDSLGTPPDPPGSESLNSHAPGNAMWQGVAGYVIVALTDDLQFALRGEVFDDPDGVRTLVRAGFGPGAGATYWELTPTVTYKIADGLFWRNEYRHDESDKWVFPYQDTYVRGQNTLATELVYTF